MKKAVLVILLLICMYTDCAFAAALDLTDGENTVNVLDGTVSQKYTETAPYADNGSMMIPIRIVAETFGAVVEWDDSAKLVTITDGSTVVKLVIGSNTAFVNGSEVIVGTPPCEINGRTMIPVEFTCESLGYYVRYIGETSQVIITNETPIMRVGNETVYFDEFAMLFNADRDKYIGEEEILAKSCISALFDNYVLYCHAVENGVTLSDELISEISDDADKNAGEYTLKSIYMSLKLKYAMGEIFSENMYDSLIPEKEEVLDYYEKNYPSSELTDELYSSIEYEVYYNKCLEYWDALYDETDDEMYFEISELVEMVK